MPIPSDYRCCDHCGRDTKNKCGLCSQCLSGKPSYVRFMGEQKGRKSRYMKAVDDEEAEVETSDSRYHGDNYE